MKERKLEALKWVQIRGQVTTQKAHTQERPALPGDVGLHALRVLWLLPLQVEMLGQVVRVTLPGFRQTQLHDARVVTHRRQSVTHHTQLEGGVHRLQQLKQ